nr:phage terminase large subunit [Peptostreptococcus anaerobius]
MECGLIRSTRLATLKYVSRTITVKTIIKTIKLQWNKIFKPVNECRKRYRVLKGSAGSGKSTNIAQDYIKKSSDSRYKGANLLVVRKVDESNRDSTFAELQSAIYKMFGDQAERVWKVTQSPLKLECLLTGNSIIFRGMKDDKQREKVKSITFKTGKLVWIWVEEATELAEADIDILDDRLRGCLGNPNLYYQITFIFNPVSSRHWIKEACWQYKGKNDVYELIDVTDHSFNDVPVVEYVNNKEEQGDFEQVISLIDAYNKSQSNTLNDMDQFTDAYLILVNMNGTDSKRISELKKDRVMLLDEDGDAKWLTKDIELFTDINIKFANTLPQNVYELSQTIKNLSPYLSNETLLNQLPFIDNAKEEVEKKKTEEESEVSERYDFTVNGGVINDEES